MSEVFRKENVEKSVQECFKKILTEYNLQFPLSWVWIGVNGAFLTGRFELSRSDVKLKSIHLSGKAEKLRPPVNAMIVDARGYAVHIFFGSSGEVSKMTYLCVDEPPPIAPLNWPKA